MSISPCLVSSDSTEWYTPKEYVNAARQVMGSIDVDPASNDMANVVVRAAMYYTKETNGYDKPWHGNVWLNPPYGYDGKRPNQSRWTQRLIEQFQAGTTQQAILLVNSKTGDRWFQPLYDYPICFPAHRIKFWTPNGVQVGTPMSSAIVYLGPNIEKFYNVFHRFGRVVRAYDIPQVPTLWEVAS